MILICPTPDTLHTRIRHEPRFSKSQREVMRKVAKEDPKATLRGVDQHMRPVIVCQTNGSARKVTYALMRNGDPARPVMPLYEDWSDDVSR